MKATELLHEDHETVDRLLEELITGNTGSKNRAEMASEVVRELSIHAAIEEQLLYPLVRKTFSAHEPEVMEDLEEHHVVKVLASEIEGLDADDPRLVAKAKVLAENVRHHVEEEESQLFPLLEQELTTDELDELGDELARARTLAPTRAHPHGPDEPPANLVNLAAGVLDRIRDRIGV